MVTVLEAHLLNPVEQTWLIVAAPAMLQEAVDCLRRLFEVELHFNMNDAKRNRVRSSELIQQHFQASKRLVTCYVQSNLMPELQRGQDL